MTCLRYGDAMAGGVADGPVNRFTLPASRFSRPRPLADGPTGPSGQYARRLGRRGPVRGVRPEGGRRPAAR